MLSLSALLKLPRLDGSSYIILLCVGNKSAFSTEKILNIENQWIGCISLCAGVGADQITQQWCVHNPDSCLAADQGDGEEEEERCGHQPPPDSGARS